MAKIRRAVAWVTGFALLLMVPAAAWAEQVTDALLQQLAQDDKSIRECLAKIGPVQLKKVLEARRISLRQGSGVDIIVEVTQNPDGCFLCGAKGGTQYIYGQVGGHYRLLFSTCVSDKVVPLNRFTRGLRDLKVSDPYSGTYQIFTFNGMEYKEKKKPRDMP